MLVAGTLVRQESRRWVTGGRSVALVLREQADRENDTVLSRGRSEFLQQPVCFAWVSCQPPARAIGSLLGQMKFLPQWATVTTAAFV